MGAPRWGASHGIWRCANLVPLVNFRCHALRSPRRPADRDVRSGHAGDRGRPGRPATPARQGRSLLIPADPVADPVAVPAGDPAALRAAASTLSASAETLDGAATTVEQAVATAVPSAWAGTAARSCASAEERAVADCRALVRAVREAAAAVAQLAAELSEAIDDARRAAGQAADVSAAILRADRTAAAAGPSELPALRRHAHQLASEATRARLHGEAATERARLANLAAA